MRGARMDDRPLISLCVIACNEAELLTRCLDSVTPYADEMIVVDTGSTDHTPRGPLEPGPPSSPVRRRPGSGVV